MHRPVLVREVIGLLGVKAGGVYVDATLGEGGHAEAVLREVGGKAKLLGIDRDAEALARARERLSVWGANCEFEHGDYADMIIIAKRHNLDRADAVLMDLGMSSAQVDSAERGFSVLREGPLDMRMDRSQQITAAAVVNTLDEESLAEILRKLGEEPAARRIARLIVAERRRKPIQTTTHLVEIVTKAKGGRRGKIHPATQTFQALRMAVNHELESLTAGLEGALKLVTTGGRVAVIAFHSLEDRTVKQTFARHVGRWESLPAGGQEWVGEQPAMRWVTRKPVTASQEEIESNPRARSAKLRVVEKVG
ncbi:MAG: 16S rRNA (cytosine(1402)-N(4))-methyltransferase RsmH [Verrucomicrobiota bacterium]